MVRVLHIVTYMGRGGLETMLMNYYRHIDREKLQFDFLVHRDFEADYDREILALGGRIYHVSRLVPWSGHYRAELRAFFRSHPEYRIVHVHQDCLSSVALQCAEECGVPVRIAHSHSSSQDRNLKYLIKRYYMRHIPRYATDLFACGKNAGDWMFGGAEYQIVNNAIDTENYRFSQEKRDVARRALGIAPDVTVIGHVGRFVPTKNHSFLLDIFSAAVEQCENLQLLLAGDGPLRPEMEEKARKLGISEKVCFLGIRSDINELMMAMDVFVFPSLYEGLPVTMVEAQAAGLPCVVSDQVSRECAVSRGLVTFQGLEASAGEWAELILQKLATPRENRLDATITMAYDITYSAKQLENFYLRKA